MYTTDFDNFWYKGISNITNNISFIRTDQTNRFLGFWVDSTKYIFDILYYVGSWLFVNGLRIISELQYSSKIRFSTAKYVLVFFWFQLDSKIVCACINTRLKMF